MEKKKTLYVTDLDGTLLNNDSIISPKSKLLLNELADAGALISIATARTPATAVDIFKDIKLNVPAVVMTGAALYDFNNNKYLQSRFIDSSIAIKAIEIMRTNDLDPFIYVLRTTDEKLHAFHGTKMESWERDFYSVRRDKSLKQFHFDENPNQNDLQHCFLIFTIGKRKKLHSVAHELEEAIGYSPSYYNDLFDDTIGFLEVFAPDVNKAHGVQSLKEYVNADRLVTFGDNINDIPMLKIADCGVVVENAFSQAKEAADVIIGSNQYDAVAQYIHDDFFNSVRV